jgi:predicted aminopeptidase
MKWVLHAWLILLPLVIPWTLITGCAGPAYYGQAISGHLALMRSRVPVDAVLQDPSTDPELAATLRQTRQILEFARDRLWLHANRGYQEIAITGRKAVTWNVVAAKEFSIDPRVWCFPVAGCVPYRGYFEPRRADKFAGRMRARGLDVMVSPAIAYSTLGWFEDPLLDTMLQYSGAQLAGIMFHELAHEKLYVRSDTDFSEAFAGFVEEIGVQLWAEETGRPEDQAAWERRRQAAVEFNRMLQKARAKLEQVYSSGLPDETRRLEKAAEFAALKDNYERLVQDHWGGADYFSAWMTGELNNAHLALMSSYEGGHCAFAALYEESGRDLELFYTLAGTKAALDKAPRSAWLNQPCQGPAERGEP